MNQTIHHLEPLQNFLQRAVEFNRIYSADNQLHDAALADRADRHEKTLAERAAKCRRALATIHKNFPNGAPLHEQGAYLLRAFTGLKPFDEGNYRTGWDMLAAVLAHHEHELMALDQEGRELGTAVWQRAEELYPKGLPASQIAAHDELFEFLADWLHHRVA
jgi:hypothetical protein